MEELYRLTSNPRRHTYTDLVTRTFYGSKRRKNGIFFARGACPLSLKKYMLTSEGSNLKFECKKFLFNICCQDEVFFPDMLSSHSNRRKLTFYCSKIAHKKSFICQIVYKLELNPSYIGDIFSSQKWVKRK